MPRLFRTALALGVLSAVGAMALVPYLMVLQPEVFAALPLPLPAVLALQGVQGTVLFTLLAFAGLRAGAPYLPGAPLVQSRVEHGPALPIPWRTLAVSAVAGFGLALVVVAVDPLFGLPAPEAVSPGPWRGLLASLYGAITEEVQLRVFLMGVLARLLGWLSPRRDLAMAAAVVLAAVLFGLGHLPAAFGLWEPSVAVVARTLVLNGLLGLPFGWLYWKRGFGHAAAAHLGADLALHVVVPLVA